MANRFTTAAVVLAACIASRQAASAAPPAFPGAVGQGAAATGGRGGDVYRVTTLADYDPDDEEKIEGSLRHAIRSAEGPRTIVFDVGGAIALHAPLEIRKNDLTIAGQTSPSGVTLWGYPAEVSRASNVVIRYLRVRTGDFHARRRGGQVPPGGNNDMDPSTANGMYVGNDSDLVILDHVSVSWGIDETLSVTKARNVTIQNSIIAESLNHSLHPKGDHGFGSLVRGELTPADQRAGIGGFTFYRNLWAHHRARSPSLGGQQTLDDGQRAADRRRTDVNLVNNVVYNWGDQATHRSELGEVRVNVIGNYYIAGPAKAAKYFFRENTPGRTVVYQRGNAHDLDQDADHDGAVAQAAIAATMFRDFGADDVLASEGAPLNFLGDLAKCATSPEDAYKLVIAEAGASLWRDAADRRVIESVVARTGGLVDSQEQFRSADGGMPGVDDLETKTRPDNFDSDGDGMPNDFEAQHGLSASDPSDGNATTLSGDGYTNLEVYLNRLVESGTGE